MNKLPFDWITTATALLAAAAAALTLAIGVPASAAAPQFAAAVQPATT